MNWRCYKSSRWTELTPAPSHLPQKDEGISSGGCTQGAILETERPSPKLQAPCSIGIKKIKGEDFMTGTYGGLVWVLNSYQGWYGDLLVGNLWDCWMMGGPLRSVVYWEEEKSLGACPRRGSCYPSPCLCLFIFWTLWCGAALCHQESLSWCVVQIDGVQRSQIEITKPKLTFHPLKLFISSIFASATIIQHRATGLSLPNPSGSLLCQARASTSVLAVWGTCQAERQVITSL